MSPATTRLSGKAGRVALVGFLVLCIYTLFSFYQQDRIHLERITTGFRILQHQEASNVSTTDNIPHASASSEPAASAKQIEISGPDYASGGPSVELVVASLSTENTSWIAEQLPDWDARIYHVDDASAALTVPLNKGKEAMVYLTWIIDSYNNLPDIAIFTHASRFQWHNDDPDYDGLAVLRKLQLSYVEAQGYVNLRCTWILGCPVEIRPLEDENSVDEYKKAARAFKKSFEEILPGEEVPEAVGQSCCAQFAVTRASILARDRSAYEGMRQWILDTDLQDHESGRVFEYMWHIIFGKAPVYCPDAGECYCRLFGLCELKCEQGYCDGRYSLPSYTNLPEGWPYVDWDGTLRDYVDQYSS